MTEVQSYSQLDIHDEWGPMESYNDKLSAFASDAEDDLDMDTEFIRASLEQAFEDDEHTLHNNSDENETLIVSDSKISTVVTTNTKLSTKTSNNSISSTNTSTHSDNEEEDDLSNVNLNDSDNSSSSKFSSAFQLSFATFPPPKEEVRLESETQKYPERENLFSSRYSEDDFVDHELEANLVMSSPSIHPSMPATPGFADDSKRSMDDFELEEEFNNKMRDYQQRGWFGMFTKGITQLITCSW